MAGVIASISSFANRLWGPLQHSNDRMPSRHRQVLAALLVTSFIFRLAIGWRLPNIHQADEVFMVAEQANRLVTGFGVIPWEFRTGSRPALLATMVEPIYRLDVSAAAHRLLQAALFCGLSLIPVCIAFLWSRRLFGLRGGVIAAAVMTTWFELVLFAPKATVDAVCSYLLLAGLFLVRPGVRPAAVCAGAFALAIALAMRVQIAPAVMLVLVLACPAGGRRRVSALLAGVIAGLLTAGVVEWRWWGTPFQGQIGYLMVEFTHQVSQFFGREPLTFYARQYILMYGMALPALAFLAYRGAAKAPILLVVAVTVLVPFQFVPHKEYRFIIAGLPFLVLLIGLGMADLVTRVNEAARSRTQAAVLAGWGVAMMAGGLSDTYRPYWTRDGNNVLAFEDVGRQPDACGVALDGIGWWQTPGYSGLGSNIPFYEITGGNEARMISAANYLLKAPLADPPPAPYERWREYTRPLQYLYRRPGGCVPDPASQVIRPFGVPGVE
jgi:GPI mannosyltransferase 3